MRLCRFRLGPALCAMLMLAPAHLSAQIEERMMYASVVDKAGTPVFGLGDRDFVVREDNVIREVLRVAPDRDPMQIALLVDDSRFMRGREGPLRKALSTFVTEMRPDVMIAVIGLGERPTIRADYTRDKAQLLRTISMLFGHGNNTLNDAIFEASAALAKRPLQRPVIVAVTAVGGGGFKQREDVVRALKWTQASLHIVNVTSRGGGGSRMTEEATRITGGRDDVIIGMVGLERHMIQLASELSNQYRVTYARPLRLIPPKKTEIKARNPELRARGLLVKTEKEQLALDRP